MHAVLKESEKGEGKVHLSSATSVHTLPSAALSSQTGPAFSLGRSKADTHGL